MPDEKPTPNRPLDADRPRDLAWPAEIEGWLIHRIETTLRSMADPTTLDKKTPILLHLYKESADQARHLDVQRSTISTIIGAAAGVVLGLAVSKENFRVEGNKPLLLHAGFLVLLGWVGFRMSRVLYQRSRLHVERLKAVRLALRTLTGLPLSELVDLADIRQYQTFPDFYKPEAVDGMPVQKRPVNRIWEAFHGVIMATGIVLAFLILSGTGADRPRGHADPNRQPTTAATERN